MVIAFQACLTRQVPALQEPCQNAGTTDTAYSRVSETVNLSLLPGIAPVPVMPYWRLRLLFWLDPPKPGVTVTTGEQEVLDARNHILSLPIGQQPAAYLKAFRKFAAMDEIDLRPATTPDGSTLLFPAADDTCLLLANIGGITLADNAGVLTLTGGTVDTSVRPSHVATATVEELLCGPTFRDNPPAPVKQGPRVTSGSLTIAGTTVTFTVDSDVNGETVQPPAFSATFLDSSGASAWQDLGITAAAWAAPTKTVTLTLGHAPGKGLLRLIARGTGPMPLLGANSIALGGTSSSVDGQDFVWMKEVS